MAIPLRERTQRAPTANGAIPREVQSTTRNQRDGGGAGREGEEQKGESERRAEGGRAVRGGYTPEPVCGQRCESPHLHHLQGEKVLEP